MTEPTPPRPRREFTAVFKAGAVFLATTSQTSIAQTAHDLGIGDTQLCVWIAAAGAPERRPSPDARTALATLRREADRAIRRGMERLDMSVLTVATATDAYARAEELVRCNAERYREWVRRRDEAAQEVASEKKRSSDMPTAHNVRTYLDARLHWDETKRGAWKAGLATTEAETARSAARDALKSALMYHHVKQAPQVRNDYARLLRAEEEAKSALVEADRNLAASTSLADCKNLVAFAQSEEVKANVAEAKSERALTIAHAYLITPQRKVSDAEAEATYRWNLLDEAKTQAEKDWRQFVAAREQKKLDQAREEAASFIRAMDQASKFHVANTIAAAEKREATHKAIQARDEAAKRVEAQRMANGNHEAAKKRREEHFNANKRILQRALKAKGRRRP